MVGDELREKAQTQQHEGLTRNGRREASEVSVGWGTKVDMPGRLASLDFYLRGMKHLKYCMCLCVCLCVRVHAHALGAWSDLYFEKILRLKCRMH